MSGEFYVDTEHGEIGLEEWSATMARFPQYADRAIASALKSEGWRLQQEIKRMLLTNAATQDLGWQPINPQTPVWNRAQYGKKIKNYRLSRKGISRGGEGKRSYKQAMIRIPGVTSRAVGLMRPPLLKLAGGTRYSYSPAIQTVTIGFLGMTDRNLMRKHAVGFRTPVTPALRRKSFAIGMPLKKETTALVVPPRPVVGPVFRREQAAIYSNIKLKAIERVVKYAAGQYKFDDLEKVA